jgi:TRAP-type C4-dicarboxylate transport system substrate-binding protein
MNRKLACSIIAGAVALTASIAQAQQKYEMKVAYFVGDQHPVSQWLVKWSDGLEKASGGRIVPKRFPGGQMGPTPQHYDFARTGQAEVSWFLTGGTPGRFPVSELINLPYLVGSAEIGAKVLNDPELRTKYLDPEHKGVKVLLYMTHQPGQIITTKKAIRTVDDMKGMRIRFSSPTIRDFVGALGATPVGVQPTELSEALQKGTVDGAFIDYGGAGIAFKLGGIIKYSTEMYSYVASFGIAMNPDWYNKLPADLKKLVDDSVTGKEKEIGEAWDSIDGPGKKLLVDGGAEAFKLSAAEDAKFRKIGAEMAEAKIKELEGKGLPARAAYNLMKSLADKHAKTSRNFWN